MDNQIKISKSEFFKDLHSVFQQIKDNKKITSDIIKNLKDYRVLPGTVLDYLSGKIELDESNIQLITIIAEQVYVVTGNRLANPLNTLTDREVKEIKSNFEGYDSEKGEFPYTFKDVTRVTDDFYVVNSSAKEISFLFNNSLLQWNPETQREAKQKTDKSTGEIIEAPKLVDKNVKEIKEATKKGELNISEITLNARLGSSDSGEEIIYDPSSRELTVTEGTLLDVLDGFHRTNGISQALRENPSIDQPMLLYVLNYDKKRAQRYFSQKNTFTLVSRSHIKKMGETRQADFIAKQVQANSELSGYVAAGDRVSPNSNFLLTFGTLSDAIDESFNIIDRPSAFKVSKFLTEFFNALCFNFPEEFLGNVSEIRKSSLINSNVMFYGYVQLAKRMYDENIDVNNIDKILQQIDFSKENDLWQKIKVLNEDLKITNSVRAKRAIIKLFNDLKIDK